ncbi:MULTISPECIES: ATP adenylyltransferase family protein [Hydrocarboniphaga]|uniref:ATP adenylyltransferase family protein n=1 Tax=Hydrocarboniphaga TaxID=243627 RepID=UPI002ABD0E2E|nr:DUF4922 domain-containing protein [Hydrocarboniphaga sp.]MDZ4078922.1 DUF4922 domain-containing protein [Hydrocarboniphaga sp.]
MSPDLAKASAETTQRALASGALVPFHVAREAANDNGLPYRIEWASSLERKDQASIPKPGAKPSASFNPFLPYDPALHVADLGDEHVLLLNKFPVLLNHVLVISRAFVDQELALQRTDFAALALAMRDIDGLAFYNSGTTAGASVQHRHLQIAPFSAPLIEALLPGAMAGGAVQQLDALPFRHAFVRFDGAWPDSLEAASARLHEAYRAACEFCGLRAAEGERLPPYNLLAMRGWMLLVPRSRETWEHGDERISLNAMSFGGSIFVRQPELIALVREAGLLRILSAVTFPKNRA